jgi:hypothetical protein
MSKEHLLEIVAKQAVKSKIQTTWTTIGCLVYKSAAFITGIKFFISLMRLIKSIFHAIKDFIGIETFANFVISLLIQKCIVLRLVKTGFACCNDIRLIARFPGIKLFQNSLPAKTDCCLQQSTIHVDAIHTACYGPIPILQFLSVDCSEHPILMWKVFILLSAVFYQSYTHFHNC